MSLTCRVRIVLNVSPKRAEAVRAALAPDNVDFPDGLDLHMENVDNGLALTFESSGEMGHLVGTVDEVLEHAQIALKVTE